MTYGHQNKLSIQEVGNLLSRVQDSVPGDGGLVTNLLLGCPRARSEVPLQHNRTRCKNDVGCGVVLLTPIFRFASHTHNAIKDSFLVGFWF